jgi:hypothetical protein
VSYLLAPYKQEGINKREYVLHVVLLRRSCGLDVVWASGDCLDSAALATGLRKRRALR